MYLDLQLHNREGGSGREIFSTQEGQGLRHYKQQLRQCLQSSEFPPAIKSWKYRTASIDFYCRIGEMDNRMRK